MWYTNTLPIYNIANHLFQVCSLAWVANLMSADWCFAIGYWILVMCNEDKRNRQCYNHVHFIHIIQICWHSDQSIVWFINTIIHPAIVWVYIHIEHAMHIIQYDIATIQKNALILHNLSQWLAEAQLLPLIGGTQIH